MRRVYNIKKTISMRQFISEFGEGFSEHMKEKLTEIGSRCVLTRKDIDYRLNLKHIEHTKYECALTSEKESSTVKKEYVYGQFVVQDGKMYFSERCTEANDTIEAPIVEIIYNSLNTKSENVDDINGKLVDDSNIDYIIDSLLKVCPPVSQTHLEMVQGMTYRSER